MPFERNVAITTDNVVPNVVISGGISKERNKPIFFCKIGEQRLEAFLEGLGRELPL
jgi:hypothetical protein